MRWKFFSGQAHHMFSLFLNLRFFSQNFLCFIFLQGRSFLLRSKMLIIYYYYRKRHFAGLWKIKWFHEKMRTFIDSGFVKNMWWTRYQRRKWKAKKASCGWLQTCARLWWIYSNISCHVSWKGTAWWSIRAQSQFNQVCFEEFFCEIVLDNFKQESNHILNVVLTRESCHFMAVECWIWCWKLNLWFLFSCHLWSKEGLITYSMPKLKAST